MIVHTIETPSLGDRSYLVHDGEVALVIDPQRDLDRVLSAAEEAGVTISHIAETHLHNDYVSGGLALSRRTGATYLHAAAEELPFDHRGVGDDDTIEVGTLTVRVLATPGHTQHHLSYHVTESGDEAGPGALFTGGSLLYGSVGRTDLVAADLTDTLTRQQYRSVRGMIDSLPGGTHFYPTHGFGSFCSSSEGGDDSDGTLTGERSVNLALTIEDEDDFVERLMSGLSDHPAYYAQMGPMNRAGGIPVDLSPAAPVDPTELSRRIHRGERVVDLRNRRAYATDHVVGTIGIELDDPFATYLGWLIPWERHSRWWPTPSRIWRRPSVSWFASALTAPPAAPLAVRRSGARVTSTRPIRRSPSITLSSIGVSTAGWCWTCAGTTNGPTATWPARPTSPSISCSTTSTKCPTSTCSSIAPQAFERRSPPACSPGPARTSR